MGGGAMRAAAKMAGIGAAGGGIFGITKEHYSAARMAASARAAAATSEEMKLAAKNSEAGSHRPCLEADEWVFPDAVEEVGERLPRVVFGGAPTLQEAKEATDELSAALENAYLLAPNSAGNDGSDQNAETKACITTQLTAASSVPAPAIMAFKFLHESSMAKNVVASIACDQNVWKAVLQNEDLQQFLQSHTHSDSGSDTDSWKEPFAYSGQNSPMGSGTKSFSGSSKHAEYEVMNGFVDMFQKMKSSVVDMVSNLSGYMQNLFGVKDVSGLLVNSDGSARVSADAMMQASFMGLAVMAILVILLKRATPVN